MQRMVVYADPDDLELIKQAAKRRGVAEGEIIREGIHLAAMSNRVWDEPLDWPVFDGDGEPVSNEEITSAVAEEARPSPARASLPGMEPREGVFWDIQSGRVDPPPAAVTLGWEVVKVAPEVGTLDLVFDAGERFLNPAGTIQGGFLAAMLDDTMGPALVATLPPGHFAPTLDLQVQFVRPARPGRIFGHGEVVKRGRDICFLAGRLTDGGGRLLATGTATARIQPISHEL